MSSRFWRWTAASAAVVSGIVLLDKPRPVHAEPRQQDIRSSVKLSTLPTRAQSLRVLHTNHFDVVIIGGGCLGSGVALDAVTRGLKTALVDAHDFGSGTSGRSSKMLHNGARSFRQAIFGLDWKAWKFMWTTLQERANIESVAPHLTKPFPILMPAYHWWQLPLFWIGVKLHDTISGSCNIQPGFWVGKSRALEMCPSLDEHRLVGGVVYYDGIFDDARLNLAVAQTAAEYGAAVTNYVKCVGLVKNQHGLVEGVKVQDSLTGEEWAVSAKCVINATGSWSDTLRQHDDASSRPLYRAVSAVHVVLPSFVCPQQVGLIDASDPQGRLLFLVPWKGKTLARVTGPSGGDPKLASPNAHDVEHVLKRLRKNSGGSDHAESIGGRDISAVWSAQATPLVNSKEEHIITVSSSKLVSVVGGHWTTYRHLAEQTVDAAVQACGLQPASASSRTLGIRLRGADQWMRNSKDRLMREFGVAEDTAAHLAETYGGEAQKVLQFTQENLAAPRRLHADYPYLEQEVLYAIRFEQAMMPEDVLARRLPLALLDAQAAMDCVRRVTALMASELNWNDADIEVRSFYGMLMRVGLE